MNKNKQTNENRQLLIILLVVFIGFVGTSMAYPIFPPLFLNPQHNELIPVAWGNSARSIFLGLALAAYPLGQFIGAPILGEYSDRYGRKRILMISLATSVLGYLLSALSLSFNWLGALLLSRFLTGLMESNFGIVRAMAADMKTINKFKSIGKINAASSIGYVMGPLLGGFLADKSVAAGFSFALPFFVAALFCVVALYLTASKVTESKYFSAQPAQSLCQQFNMVRRFQVLLRNNVLLKRILIIATIFTFSVDLFFEFGPVYLTGLWQMTPAEIAIYNAALSLTLAIGHGWLSHYLTRHFSNSRTVVAAILMTALVFLLLVLFPYKIFALILFSLAGISIALGSNTLTIQISDAASKTIQGEVLGSQLALRMLGDALICLMGGFLIISSVLLPIAISCLIALTAALLYRRAYK